MSARTATRRARRARGKRERRRRFEEYVERVGQLVKEGRSPQAIASVTRTDEELVLKTIKLLAS